MANVNYRFRIYTSGSTAVEITFGSSQVQGFEEIGGADVRPLEGRIESRPWNLQVADISTAVSSVLADSSGRMNLLGRLAEVQRDFDNSSSWNTLVTGRVADIGLSPEIASYAFGLEDEHYLARRSVVFRDGTTTVYVWPPGLASTWFSFAPRTLSGGILDTTQGNLAFIQFDRDVPKGRGTVNVPMSQDLLNLLKDDFLEPSLFSLNQNTTKGNFRTLRFRYAGADYEVWGIGFSAIGGNLAGKLNDDPHDFGTMQVWVVDSAGALPAVDTRLEDIFLYMPTHVPTETLPLHIGGANGIHPFQLVKDIYDGNYGETTIRYDSTALNNLINNKFFRPIWFRITEPANMGEWLETHIYGPLGVVPFVNADGRIEPQVVFLPSSDVVDIDSILALTSTNLAQPHPTWQHGGREIVTKLRFRDPILLSIDEAAGAATAQFPADFIDARERIREYTHDRLAMLGERSIDYELPIEMNAEALAAERFDRFGDGPIWGTLHGMTSGTSGMAAGDYVTLSLNTVPNPFTGSRGGTRIVQLLSRTETMVGPVFDWLDVGPDAAVLSSPTISATTSTGAANTAPAYHELKVTLSNVTTDGGWELQAANAASTLGISSTAWFLVGSSQSSQVVTVSGLRSGSTYWFRARNRKPQRWRSAWAYTTAGVATQELAGPSGLLSSGHTAATINYAWTNTTASTGYDLELLGTTFGGAATRIDLSTAGSNRYQWTSLDAATTYSLSIRYLDAYGGYSPSTTLTTETTSTGSAPTAASISNIWVVLGYETTGEQY